LKQTFSALTLVGESGLYKPCSNPKVFSFTELA